MTNFKHQSKRLLSVALALVMMLSAIPFVSFAADEAPAKEYVYFGTYKASSTDSAKPLKWLVLSKDGGKLLLVTEGVLYKPTKFHDVTNTAVTFETSTLFAKLNGSDATSYLNTLFTAAEREELLTHDVTYGVWDTSNNPATSYSVTTSAKITIPSKAVCDAYSTYFAARTCIDRSTTSASNYWLADASASTKTNKNIMMVNGNNGTVTTGGALATTNNFGVRPIILVDAAGFVTFTAADNATFTNTYGDAIANATLAVDAQFKVVLDENYNQSVITVKANGTALTADGNGVYTIPAGAADATVTVEGITPNPADFTAYNQAVASTQDLEESDYSAETWAALQQALAVDVSAYGIDRQADVNAAAAAITAAVGALKLRPADFTAFDAALEKTEEILTNAIVPEYNSSIYVLKEVPTIIEEEAPDINYLENGNSCELILMTVKSIYPSATVHSYTFMDQDKVDEATAALEWAISLVPMVTANANIWQELVNDAATLNPNIYMNVPEYQARVAEVVAEHNYIEDRVDITHQAEVDASAQRIRDIINECKDRSNWIPADYTELDRLIELADTYLEENYYKDEDLKKDKSLGGTAAWEDFARARDAAKAIDRELNCTRHEHQDTINGLAEDLLNRMNKLDPFIRLSPFNRFITDTRDAFAEFGKKLSEFGKLITAVFGLIGSLFRGEIDIYSILETAGVDDPKLVAFLEKLGFKHIEVTIDPTVPQD